MFVREGPIFEEEGELGSNRASIFESERSEESNDLHAEQMSPMTHPLPAGLMSSTHRVLLTPPAVEPNRSLEKAITPYIIH